MNNELDFRLLNEEDYEIICEWWRWWRWTPVERELLPNNGTGGFMVHSNNVDICAGFLYTTNSNLCHIEWIVSNYEIKDKTLKVAEKVTEKKDRLELCIFNKVFSERVLGYDADVQQVNDIYTESGKILFKDSLKGKYNGYGAGVVSLISEITGNENHKLTQAEKEKISQVFNGLSWSLIN